MTFDRRNFLRRGAAGLAAAGIGALTLRSDAAPTEPSGEAHAYREYLISVGEPEPGGLEIPPLGSPGKLAATEDNILGPYYRPGAPFRPLNLASCSGRRRFTGRWSMLPRSTPACGARS